MKWLAFLFIVVIPQTLLASQNLPSDLISLLNNHQVLILGEKHKQPESTKLLTDLVRQYTNSGKCLTVALEIASDQQAAIDQGPISAIKIHPIIDHPGYRTMLSDLHDLQHAGRCINILAIDAPRGSKTSRDTHMAEMIFQASQTNKVIALVGNSHAIKKIKWQKGIDSPTAAQQLLSKGVDLITVLQKWEKPSSQKELKGSLIDINQDLAQCFLRSIAAHSPGNPKDVADKVIVWENYQ